MKKKLEAELISIAHRILKMKNRDDVVQLHQEAQKLYEKLSILRFYEENIAILKPALGQEELEKKMEQAYETPTETAAEEKTEVVGAESNTPVVESAVETDMETPVEEEKIVVGEIAIDEDEMYEDEIRGKELHAEEIIEEEEEPATATEEAEALLFEPVAEEPAEELKAEQKSGPKQISLEDLLGTTYGEPDFVKVDEVPAAALAASDLTFEKAEKAEPKSEKKEIVVEESTGPRPLENIRKEIEAEKAEYKALSLNDKFNKTITLGLNDRIAFEKHLFAGSGEDLNRVLSQLNTFNTIEEAKGFIDDLVKPDYNDWQGKDEYSSRFMELVEKKFA